MFRSPSARHNVESILAGTVEEVILQVSYGGLVDVVEGTLLRALPSSGEVGLKSTSSAVCL